ncbi:carbohydrate kinase family protein [Seonamhaeicola marinus]|uniref:Ribokinase n=1 Tax=Seonamhaeicola marinus TaxID=1912246 RepID=A0A5D0H405_9FLAO|nr:PfkB family carbohydrate kinase [Seonamhaeicola marinus]TYA66014.1 ribokinase [Seonamhaeicola marinus]
MKVLCSGLNVVDLLVATPNRIKVGHKNECEKIVLQGGAPAGNAACALASLGFETYFLGYLGDNPLSVVAENELKRHGVKDDLLFFRKEASPAVAIVQVDEEGERTVLYSMENYIPFSFLDIEDSQIEAFDLILVDGYDTEINLHLLRVAKRFGIPTVLDIEAGDMETMLQMLKLSTHPILPLECAQNITGAQNAETCLSKLSDLTEGQVVITDGANGAYTMADEQLIHQPSFKVDVVDTTGCGDAFHAAYAAALLRGLNLKDRLEYGSFYASQVAQHFGGRTFLPNHKFMEDNCPQLITD